jgi:Putative phage abortive infection protein
MDDDHFLKRMFGKSWAKDTEKIIVNAIGFFVLGAIVCAIGGIYEWVKGIDALEAATGTGQTSSQHLEHLGSFGSFLQGSTGTLWALAGFFIIFVAFLIQALQFAEQRKQFKIQTDSIARQNFESSFFQMLNLHNEIVLSMTDVDTSKAGADVAATGRECFKRWFREFKGGMWGFKIVEEAVEYVPKNNVERYLAFYYEAHQAEFGHYFRNLYHLIKFVNEAKALKNADQEKEYKDRHRYTSLVRATLSQYELFFLFYNCASPLGNERFKPLVKKYELLENFNDADLLKPKEDWEFYKDETVKKPEHES